MATKISLSKVGDTWFRYRDAYYSGWCSFTERSYPIGPLLELETFEVVKLTPKGVWLARLYSGNAISSERRFVRLAAHRRWAQPSKAEALNELIGRKSRQVLILEKQLENARKAIQLGTTELAKQFPNEPALPEFEDFGNEKTAFA